MTPVHYILPIRRSSYHTIQRLIASGAARSDPDGRLQHSPLVGQLYELAIPLPITALSARHIEIGPHTVQAELYRLPAAEFISLVAASPSYRERPSIQALTDAFLNTGHTVTSARQWLERVGRESPLPGQVRPPRPEAWFEATWRRDGLTLLARRGEWFLVLHFDLTCTAPHAWPRDDMALDLGWRTAVQLVSSSGDLMTVPWISLPYEMQIWSALTRPARDVLRQVLFEIQRTAVLTLTDHLAVRAKRVFVEELTYRDMRSRFVRDARARGLLDFHESWLHCRLQAAGIPFERVRPHGTSQRCHRCAHHPFGHRDGQRFSCPVCGLQMDSDINAARNILRLGAQKANTWRTRR